MSRKQKCRFRPMHGILVLFSFVSHRRVGRSCLLIISHFASEVYFLPEREGVTQHSSFGQRNFRGDANSGNGLLCGCIACFSSEACSSSLWFGRIGRKRFSKAGCFMSHCGTKSCIHFRTNLWNKGSSKLL
jgi:hypothetical protein